MQTLRHTGLLVNNIFNTDGPSKAPSREAGCGGLLPDDQGKVLGAFSYHIGACSPFNAKLWGWAWQRGFGRIILECNSKAVVQLISAKPHIRTGFNKLALLIYNWLDKGWMVQI